MERGRERFAEKEEIFSFYLTQADTEFPVIGEEYLWILTKAIEWLNRKVQETVTVEIQANIRNGVLDVEHIVDFTERIKFDGNAGTATGTEETTIQNKIHKFIYNDQMYILKDGVLYDARGMLIRR